MAITQCACDNAFPSATLISLRTRLLTRLGFAAQLAAPPPGIPELLNDLIQQAQDSLFQDYSIFQTERYFTWTMVADERFYDLPGNDEQTATVACTKLLDPNKIQWAGIQYNGAMRPLLYGIPPILLRDPDTSTIPYRYEIRQCIEVWPAPSDEMLLVLKGHFGLLPLLADTDTTTIDQQAIFLLAIANAKAHFGQPDAGNAASQAANYVGAMVAGGHRTSRYIPSAGIELAAVPPHFLPLDAP